MKTNFKSIKFQFIKILGKGIIVTDTSMRIIS